MTKLIPFLCLFLIASLAGCQCDGDKPVAVGSGATTSTGNSRPLRAESGETVLASNPDQAGQTFGNERVDGPSFVAVTFKAANLPNGATSYKATSTTFRAGKLSSAVGSSAWNVWIVTCDANHKPTAAPAGGYKLGIPPVLAQAQLPASGIPVIANSSARPPTVTVSFTNSSDIQPAQEIAAVVAPQAFSPTGYVGFAAGGTQTPADMGYCVSTNSGAIWGTPTTTRDFDGVEVKGTVTTP